MVWAYVFFSIGTNAVFEVAAQLYDHGFASISLSARILLIIYFCLWPWAAREHYYMLNVIIEGLMWWIQVTNRVWAGDVVSVQAVERQIEIDWSTQRASRF